MPKSKNSIHESTVDSYASSENTVTRSDGRYFKPKETPKSYASKKDEKRETKSRKRSINDTNDDDIVVTDSGSYLVQQLVNSAEQNLGSNYRTGGTDPKGFDCSGLLYSTFKKFDISLPRSSNEMSKVGVRVKERDIQVGDFVFFRTNGKRVINHVGMVTEVRPDEIKFIHSSTQLGVIISSTKEPYYERTYAQANRIVEN